MTPAFVGWGLLLYFFKPCGSKSKWPLLVVCDLGELSMSAWELQKSAEFKDRQHWTLSCEMLMTEARDSGPQAILC